MIYKYGVDFGTTNSSIAIRFVGDDNQEHTLVVDVKNTHPRETLPSIVYINDEREIAVGEEATKKYIQNAENRNLKQKLIKKIKLDLEEKGRGFSYRVGKVSFSGVELIAAILRQLRVKAERYAAEIDVEMSGVVMGVPVQYGDEQKGVLREALYKAGFYATLEEANRNTEFVSEPIAVAIHYGLNLKHDKTVLVFDFGGGTLDLAIVNLKQQVREDVLHPHETISKVRMTLGGEELTRLFFMNSFCSNAKYGMKKICKTFGIPQVNSPAKIWEYLVGNEYGIEFISAIEQCKCHLSRAKKVKFSYLGPHNIVFDELTFYPDDFADSIDGALDEIDGLVEECMEEGKIYDPYDIDKVVVAGGSSLIPCVQNILTDRFGANRVAAKPTDDDSVINQMKRRRIPESEVLTSIVRGLAVVGCRKETIIEDVVDNNYGVWDSKENQFIPIITKGMKVKDTFFDRLTQEGTYKEVICPDKDASSVEVKVYQNNSINGNKHLGTIMISNPGGLRYKIFMKIDPKQGILEVILYDVKQRRWLDEIPLNNRTYVVSKNKKRR